MRELHFGYLVLAVIALSAGVAQAAGTNIGDPSSTPAISRDPSTLLQFYPTPLATSPVGAIEDKSVWLAKLQGLISAAPALLRQSTLASSDKAEFMANLTLLQQLQKGTLEEGTIAAKAVAASGRVSAKGANNPLGFQNAYATVTPCRIMDTRYAYPGSRVQGPILGNVDNYIPGSHPAGANWTFYGGATSDCGLVMTNTTPMIYAVAIVITILNPSHDAYLGISDEGGNVDNILSTVAVNFNRGQGTSSMYIVPQEQENNIHFALPAGVTADVIFDVVGFFTFRLPFALDCIDVVSTPATIPANSQATIGSPSCNAGYEFTSGGCIANDYGVSLVSSFFGSGQQNCAYNNLTSLPQTIKASGRCCRVPGQ